MPRITNPETLRVMKISAKQKLAGKFKGMTEEQLDLIADTMVEFAAEVGRSKEFA